jgi:hypothetical protein
VGFLDLRPSLTDHQNQNQTGFYFGFGIKKLARSLPLTKTKSMNMGSRATLITHATHSTTSGDRPLTMGNAFSISYTIFHIAVTFNSILVIKWRSYLISRVNLAPKNGVNVITSPLPMPQKPLFLYG